ncbi:MAG: magnesium transporter [Phycisphaerales bacterium]|nr:MAG: magnesium transporter [Phycisphaerales bacterium]
MTERPNQQRPPSAAEDATPDETANLGRGSSEEVTRIEDLAAASPEDERVAELMAHTIDVPVLAEAVELQEAADAADTLEDLEEEEAVDVLEAMDDRAAAEALAEMEDPLAAGAVEQLIDEDKAGYAARMLQLMDPDDAADLLQELFDEPRELLFEAMPAETAVNLRRLIAYAEDTAAGLMTTKFLALREDMTVAQATEAIRATAIPQHMHYLPVQDDHQRLRGIIGFRRLLTNPAEASIGELMDDHPKVVRANLDQEEVAREFDRYDFYMLPVVDEEDHLLGIVTVDDVIDIIREEQTEDVQRTVGAGAEEAVYSGVVEKFKGRFPWLVVSTFIMIPSAWVVLQFEGLIGELAILAVLMPVIAALAGNSGHQALAVTQRGIVLDEVRPDRVWPLLRREALVGVLTGATLGCLVGLGVTVLAMFAASASWRLGAVVALSTTVSLAIGTTAGSSIPLIMRRLGFDPALGSAILVIMITDTVAFATFLGMAYFSQSWLMGPLSSA